MADAVFVYDDDCGFCTWWAELFDAHADVRLLGFSEVGPGLRERLPDEFQSCSHLVTDSAVCSCGASIEEALLRTAPGAFARPAVELLRQIDAYRTVREWGYRRGANNRDFWGKLVSKTPPARKINETGADTE